MILSAHSVTLGLLETQNTKEFLELLGFRQTAEDGPSIRMEVGDGGSGRTIDLLAQPDVPPGTWTHANGIHHHFAVATDTEGSSLLAGPHTEAPEADTFVHQPLPGRVVFGPGTSRSHLAPELDRLGVRRVLLIAAPSARGLAAELVTPLGARVTGTFDDVHGHVPLEVAEAPRQSARDARADCVLSIGGGSAIGAAKAVALELGLPIAAIPHDLRGLGDDPHRRHHERPAQTDRHSSVES
jgi:hypothetical protein